MTGVTKLVGTKRRLYPTVLCYHGCVSTPQEALTFRENIADIKAHVMSVLANGYEFIWPSEYELWQTDPVYREAHPNVVQMQFDDGLSSVELISDWLNENKIKWSYALITRRQRILDPEPDFASWEYIRRNVEAGYMELMSHTHNMHHLTIHDAGLSDGDVVSAPVLEGPCWVDTGDVVYQEAGDPRWFWDYSIIDTHTLAIPLFGTDQWDGATPVVTTLHITPKASGAVHSLRLLMSLSFPSGGGYNADVRISANGVQCFRGIIAPKQYETRAQWVEREFYFLRMDTPFNVTAGVPVELLFETMNSGAGMPLNALAALYALPTKNDADFWAQTNARGFFPAGSQEPPYAFWKYIDYPANEQWPVIPCVILCIGPGARATIQQYQDYVDKDCKDFRYALDNWLYAEWEEITLFTANIIVYTSSRQRIMDYGVGWNNPNRESNVYPVSNSTTLPKTFHWVRIEFGPAEMQFGGDGQEYSYVNEIPSHGIIDIQPWMQALIDAARNRSYVATFEIILGPTQTGPWNSIGLAPIWTIARGLTVEVNAFTLPPGQTWYIGLIPINRGPLSGGEQRVRWPVLKFSAGALVNNRVPDHPTHIIYPFGAYLGGDGQAVLRPEYKDIDNALRQVFWMNNFTRGYTIQSFRNVGDEEFREPDLRQSDFALGRFMLYGTQSTAASVDHVVYHSGYKFHDATHKGLKTIVDMKPDVLGNATIKTRHMMLDVVNLRYSSEMHIDFSTDPNGDYYLIDFERNDGAIWFGEQYVNDVGWLQSRGIKVLLETTNVTGPHPQGDPDLAWSFVYETQRWLDTFYWTVVDAGLDGICFDLRFVPFDVASRQPVVEAFKLLVDRFHENNLLVHARLPVTTGLSKYDASHLMGWCDHGELVKYVDAIHLTSYMAANETTNPGQHCPDDYWEGMLQYLQDNVARQYWSRLYFGVNTFGTVWPPGQPAYELSYHEGIAEALSYGADFVHEGTETGWEIRGTQCWFGTPDTLERAQETALKYGFGGVVITHLDDGDVEEFFPLWRIIGLEENMSYIDVRFPPEISYGSGGGPSFKTHVTATQSGDEFRNSLWTMPLYKYDVSEVIKSQPQWEAIRNLFLVCRGKWRSFRFKDWSDFQASAVQIGTGNGTRVNFQLLKGYAVGSQFLTRPITKPVSGTLRVFRNGTEIVGGATTWLCDYNTGIVSFQTPPTGVITATFEFDVHCRFDTDEFPSEITSWGPDGAYMIPNAIPIVEVRR